MSVYPRSKITTGGGSGSIYPGPQRRAVPADGGGSTEILVGFFFPLFDPAATYVEGQGVRSADDIYFVARMDLPAGTTLVAGDDWAEIGEITEADVDRAIAAYLADNPIEEIGGRLWTSSDTYSVGDIVSETNRLFISQTGNNTGNSPLTDSTNWREFEGGSAPHARLRVSLALSQSSIQLPILGAQTITGTVTAEIVDSVAGDVINDTIIRSVHSSYEDSRTSSPTVVSDTQSRFTWAAQPSDTARTITFTVSGTVNYVVGAQRMTHNFTETVNLVLIAEPVLFWTGAITQADLDTLTVSTNLANNTIASIPRLTQRENFSSPFTLEYDGGAPGSTPSLYPAIIVEQSIQIRTLRAEGISLSISSHNDPTAGRTLYVTEGLLSEGPHNLTWRT